MLLHNSNAKAKTKTKSRGVQEAKYAAEWGERTAVELGQWACAGRELRSRVRGLVESRAESCWWGTRWGRKGVQTTSGV